MYPVAHTLLQRQCDKYLDVIMAYYHINITIISIERFRKSRSICQITNLMLPVPVHTSKHSVNAIISENKIAEEF